MTDPTNYFNVPNINKIVKLISVASLLFSERIIQKLKMLS